MDSECGHGLCNRTECVCMDGYSGERCHHPRKSQLTSFLLGFFLGFFGGGRLYLRLIASGVIQLLFCVFCLINMFLTCCDVYEDIDDICFIIGIIASISMSLTVFVWFVAFSSFSRCCFAWLCCSTPCVRALSGGLWTRFCWA